jgi:hypothetical protein
VFRHDFEGLSSIKVVEYIYINNTIYNNNDNINIYIYT